MRKVQVYMDVILDDITVVGHDEEVELILCTMQGKETALIKDNKSQLYYGISDFKDVYKLLRLYYKGTDESLACFFFTKKELARKAEMAYLPFAIHVAV